MRKTVFAVILTAVLTVTTTVAAAPSPANHTPARWVESVADSRGGGTFAQVPFNVSFGISNHSYGISGIPKEECCRQANITLK